MTATIWITQTLNEFGRLLGFDELALDERGTLQLAFEQLGVLGVECSDTDTLVYLKRPLASPDANCYRRALEACSAGESEFDWLQAALIDDNQLAFATRLRNEDFQLSNLERVVSKLGELHDDFAEAA